MLFTQPIDVSLLEQMQLDECGAARRGARRLPPLTPRQRPHCRWYSPHPAVGAGAGRTNPATLRPVSRFNLQFDVRQVPEYAARYAYENDTIVRTIGRRVRKRGYYTVEEFVVVCRWKTPRSGPLVATNSAEEVESATRTTFSEASTEPERMEALRSLAGVEFPTASVLLHLAYPERYPILDKRTLHALGVRPPPTYSFRFWTEYVEEYRQLIEEARVDGRTLDRSLWQWSSEQNVPLY